MTIEEYNAIVDKYQTDLCDLTADLHLGKRRLDTLERINRNISDLNHLIIENTDEADASSSIDEKQGYMNLLKCILIHYIQRDAFLLLTDPEK